MSIIFDLIFKLCKIKYMKKLRKSNWTYVMYKTFTSDLLFWIVIDNLYLSTVKNFSAFQIVLITMLGLAFSLILYPLTNFIVKKNSAKTSIVIGASMHLFAIILFMVSNSLIGFVVGQIFYCVSSQFNTVANVILKNNLLSQNKQDEFVKWQSYGKLGYAIITMIVSLIAGFMFNVSAYLPLFFSLGCAVVGLFISIFYEDTKSEIDTQNETSEVVFSNKLMRNKIMILIMLMNIFAVGTYVFLQQKATLLIQYVCQDVNIDIAKISIIVSGIVFGSRVVRVLSDIIFPKIYNKTKNKSRIVIAISLLILLSNICFALGGNLPINYVVKLILITIGFYIILSVRDMYGTIENKIIATSFKQNEQKQAYVLANIYGNCGRLFSNVFALIVLGFMPLNILYICMLILAVAQIFICIPLSKHFKN